MRTRSTAIHEIVSFSPHRRLRRLSGVNQLRNGATSGTLSTVDTDAQDADGGGGGDGGDDDDDCCCCCRRSRPSSRCTAAEFSSLCGLCQGAIQRKTTSQ